MRMSRTFAAVAAAAALVAGTVFTASSASAAPPLPAKMAALGDSITQAAMTCNALTSCPTNSWSTGSTASVNSHYLRLKAAGASTLVGYNDAVSGAASAALPGQAATAAGQGAQYVTIEIGANDACTSTVAAMTPTATFRANVHAALTTLSSSAAQPQIFVASIPSLMRMYNLNKGSSTARFWWGLFGTCKSMLANPTKTTAADNSRRAAVEAQVVAYNGILASECAAVANCRFDNNAVYNYPFAKSDISTRDYFHPSLSGQANLARVTWGASQFGS